jgi:hypothetical protein
VLRVAREKDFIGLTNKCFIFFSLFAIKKQQNNKVLWSFRMYICKQLDLFPLSRTSLHFHSLTRILSYHFHHLLTLLVLQISLKSTSNQHVRPSSQRREEQEERWGEEEVDSARQCGEEEEDEVRRQEGERGVLSHTGTGKSFVVSFSLSWSCLVSFSLVWSYQLVLTSMML